MNKKKEPQPLPRARVEVIERALVAMVLAGQAKKKTIMLHLYMNQRDELYEEKEFSFYKIVTKNGNSKIKERL